MAVETCARRLRGEVCPICDDHDRLRAEYSTAAKEKREADRAEKKRLGAASLRLELEKIETATCYDCGMPINGLDRQCCDHWLSDGGVRETFWFHARCIGCDEPESVRQSAEGCGVCAREWKDETDAT